VLTEEDQLVVELVQVQKTAASFKQLLLQQDHNCDACAAAFALHPPRRIDIDLSSVCRVRSSQMSDALSCNASAGPPGFTMILSVSSTTSAILILQPTAANQAQQVTQPTVCMGLCDMPCSV